MDIQHALVVVLHGNQEAPLHEIAIEVAHVLGHLQGLHGPQRARLRILLGINEDVKVVLKETPKGLENPAFEARVVALVEDLPQRPGPHHDGAAPIGVAP